MKAEKVCLFIMEDQDSSFDKLMNEQDDAFDKDMDKAFDSF